MLIFVGSVYTTAEDSDGVWDVERTYIRTVSRMLPEARTIFLGIREQVGAPAIDLGARIWGRSRGSGVTDW